MNPAANEVASFWHHDALGLGYSALKVKNLVHVEPNTQDHAEALILVFSDGAVGEFDKISGYNEGKILMWLAQSSTHQMNLSAIIQLLSGRLGEQEKVNRIASTGMGSCILNLLNFGVDMTVE